MWPLIALVGLAVVGLVAAGMRTPKVDPPKVTKSQDIPTAEQGEVYPILFGKRRFKGGLSTWHDGKRVRAIREKQGKK